MTIKQAQQELARPLVFGDELQIKALKVLNNTYSQAVCNAVEDLLMDYFWGTKEGEVPNMTVPTFIAELQHILGNHPQPL